MSDSPEEWVRNRLDSGDSSEEVRSALVSRGWDEDEARRIVRDVESGEDPAGLSDGGFDGNDDSGPRTALIGAAIGGVIILLVGAVLVGFPGAVEETGADGETPTDGASPANGSTPPSPAGQAATASLINVSLSNVEALNPIVEEQYNVSFPICGEGAHRTIRPSSAPLNIALTVFDGDVIGLRTSWTAGYGWGTWANEPEGEPVQLNATNASAIYSQNVYLKQIPSDAECSAGEWRNDDRAADLFPASWDVLTQINPGLNASAYGIRDGCRAGRGVLRGPTNRGLQVLTFNDSVIGFQRAWGAGAGWRSWADQPSGEPIAPEWTGGNEVYTTSIFFAEPPTAAECRR